MLTYLLVALWPPIFWQKGEVRSLTNYQYSTEGQEFHENLAPVLAMLSVNLLICSRKIITSTGFYRCSARAVPAPFEGPCYTKNSTALESVVFCYRRSFSLSVPFSCLLSLEKQVLLSPLRSVSLCPYRCPHKHLEGSLAYMYFHSFSLESKRFGIHQTSILPVEALEFSELKTPLV